MKTAYFKGKGKNIIRQVEEHDKERHVEDETDMGTVDE